MVTTLHYLLLAAALFTIGVIGVLTRRNIMIILMSIELMMNAVNINLIAFSARLQQVTGQVFAIFVITVAAAEAAVGLGIVIAMFKRSEEHTSELQSPCNLVCRLLLEKKKKNNNKFNDR